MGAERPLCKPWSCLESSQRCSSLAIQKKTPRIHQKRSHSMGMLVAKCRGEGGKEGAAVTWSVWIMLRQRCWNGAHSLFTGNFQRNFALLKVCHEICLEMWPGHGGYSPCWGCCLTGYPEISSTGGPGIPGNSEKRQQEIPSPIPHPAPNLLLAWSFFYQEMCRKTVAFLMI